MNRIAKARVCDNIKSELVTWLPNIHVQDIMALRRLGHLATGHHQRLL